MKISVSPSPSPSQQPPARGMANNSKGFLGAFVFLVVLLTVILIPLSFQDVDVYEVS